MKTLHLLLALAIAGVPAAVWAQGQPPPPPPAEPPAPVTQPAGPTQPAPPPSYVDSACGAWKGDNWVPNGSCASDTHKHARVEGTITAVKGHLVTLQQATGTVTIDDTPALNNQFTGRIAVGRRIVAHGYWDSGNFYATIITTDSPTS
jgi:hypothetical protein